MTMAGDRTTAAGREGTVVILSPSGRLDGDIAWAVEGGLSAIAGRGHRAVLDCAGIVDIGPAGLRALLVGAIACLCEGNELVLAALRPGCRAVLAADGLQAALKCQDTVEAALDAYARSGPGDGNAMRISVRQEPGAVVLSLSGRLDATTAPALMNAISGALEHSRGSVNGNGGMMQ
ncbi:MAG: hypothetical protein OXH14_12985 [Alphaproteobacteria bacterium]|nr:hypothetical protein [Alphaproteobacteria bacterium]